MQRNFGKFQRKRQIWSLFYRNNLLQLPSRICFGDHYRTEAVWQNSSWWLLLSWSQTHDPFRAVHTELLATIFTSSCKIALSLLYPKGDPLTTSLKGVYGMRLVLLTSGPVDKVDDQGCSLIGILFDRWSNGCFIYFFQ